MTAVSSHCASYKWPETNKHTVQAQTQNTNTLHRNIILLLVQTISVHF